MSKDARVKQTVEHSLISVDGVRHVPGQMIRCMREGCDATERITTNNNSHRLPDEVLRKKFTQRGWLFKGKGWLCPVHAKHRHFSVVDAVGLDDVAVPSQLEAEAAFAGLLEAYSPVAKEPDVYVSPITIPVLSALEEPAIEPPKETPPVNTTAPLKDFADLAAASLARMTLSDRRRVFSAILDNWDDSRNRYEGGTTDQVLATKLGVARAWVEHIRKENFGEAAGNEEIDALREELELLDRNLTSHLDDAMRVAGNIEATQNRTRDLLKRLEVVEKAVGVRR